MKRFFCRLWMALLAVSVGCGSHGVRHTITELMETTIVFPESLQAKVLDRDTVFDMHFPEPYKLVAYLNSTQCDGCRLKDLLSWKHLMRQVDSLDIKDSVRFVFVFQPKDTVELTERLKLYNFDWPCGAIGLPLGRSGKFSDDLIGRAIFFEKYSIFINKNNSYICL